MAIGAGMTSAITNPLHQPEMESVKGANVVMSHDPACKSWIKACKSWDLNKPSSPGTPATSSAAVADKNAPKVSRRMMRKLRSG
jgi:5-methyltetrahydrofolate--homocysteine methyltransferase